MISFCVMITQIDISLFNVRNESPLSIEHFHNLSKELQKKKFHVIQAICKWFAYWKREKITAYLSISMRKEALKFCTKVQKMCGFWSAICNGNKWIEFRFLGTFAVNIVYVSKKHDYVCGCGLHFLLCMQNTLVDLLTKYNVFKEKLKKGIILLQVRFWLISQFLIEYIFWCCLSKCKYFQMVHPVLTLVYTVQQCTIGIKTNKIHKENLNASDCDKSGSFALKLLPQHPHISATALQYPAAS